eukprot:2990510-Pyramimonas_sp.AAC.1
MEGRNGAEWLGLPTSRSCPTTWAWSMTVRRGKGTHSSESRCSGCAHSDARSRRFAQGGKQMGKLFRSGGLVSIG